VNSWMASPVFDAQCAHVLAGIAAMLSVQLWWPKYFWYFLLLFLVAAAAKEFWYDATYELPVQHFSDNMLDFGMYAFGLGIGALVTRFR
jgi:hypothetical protein